MTNWTYDIFSRVTKVPVTDWGVPEDSVNYEYDAQFGWHTRTWTGSDAQNQ